ncbi:MAG: type IX secretion system membrane protein PorP/SprF [Chitinophagales bacterium]
MPVHSAIRKCLLVSCFLWGIHTSHAQIQSGTSHYMFNPQMTNPAFYGSRDGINFTANYRHQWAKLEGQPKTINIAVDARLPQAHGGIGLVVSNDMLGAFTNTSFRVGYAFIQPVRDKITIGIALSAGATFSKLDGTKLITPQGNGTGLNDDLLSNQVQRSIRPDLTVGISLVSKYLEAGISYSNLINAKDKFKGEVGTLRPKYGGVFQVYAGSKIKVGKDFSVKPSVSLITDFIEFQTDISFLAGYKEYAMLGINVRGYNKKSFESLSPVLSVSPVKNLNVIYSYDVSLNKLNKVNSGSHEITLNYLLPNKKLYKSPKMINNPRFL